MNGVSLNKIAERASHRYSEFLSSLKGIFSGALLSPNFSPSLRERVVVEAYGKAVAFLEEEKKHIETDIVNVVNDSIDYADTELDLEEEEFSLAIQENIDTLVDSLDNLYRIQIERDINTLNNMLKSAYLRNAISARSSGVKNTGGISAAIARDALARASFEFLDKAGKRWPSDRYIKTIYRHSMVMTWNETMMIRASEVGETHLIIGHPDPEYVNLNQVISLNENPKNLIWADIKEDLFHPNTSAYLKPVPRGTNADQT